MNYAIVGTGAASPTALKECLGDVLTGDDTVMIEWSGTPIPDSLDVVYGYLVDNEIPFQIYYREDQRIPQALREDDSCTPTKSRYPLDNMLKQADEVLFLWDDNENDATPPLIQYVFDNLKDGVQVKELSNGLAPIVIEDDMPEPEPAPVEDEDEQVDDTRFTRDELEVMTAAAVKRYGERLGCKAKTKSGIIEELFEDEWKQYEAPAPVVKVDNVSFPTTKPEGPKSTAPEDDMPVVAGDTQHVSAPNWDQELTILINNFMQFQKPGFETDMAHLALGQARLWMLKALAEV